MMSIMIMCESRCMFESSVILNEVKDLNFRFFAPAQNDIYPNTF
jgi:hypothetical protein